MEFVVCNKCGSSPGKKQFYITACSHIFCESCRVIPSPDYCQLCKIPTKSLKMDASLPKNVRKIFTDVATMNSDIHRRLTKIIGFQKNQKSIQLKIENKKSALRKEQIAKIEQKTQELSGQLTKLTSFEENNRKKLEETENENETLRTLYEKKLPVLFIIFSFFRIRTLELEASSNRPLIQNYEEEFFIKNTHASSSPSLTGSVTDNEEMMEFVNITLCYGTL
ncbi:unnamed protein product [Caenorhabditis brenneri]